MFALPCVGTLGPCLASAAAGCACSCCTAVTSQAMRSSARAAWSILFSFSLLVAWIARDFGASLLKQLPCEPIWVLQAAVDVSRPPSGSGGGAPPLPPTAHRPTPHPLRAAAAVLCACRGRASLHRWRPPTRLLVWAAGCVPHQHGQLGAPPLEPPLELARTELPRTWLACCRHFLPLRCVLNLFRPSPLTVPLAPLPPPAPALVHAGPLRRAGRRDAGRAAPRRAPRRAAAPRALAAQGWPVGALQRRALPAAQRRRRRLRLARALRLPALPARADGHSAGRDAGEGGPWGGVPACKLTALQRVRCVSIERRCFPRRRSSLPPPPLPPRPAPPPAPVVQGWNDAWVEAGEEDPRYFHALLAVTLGAYAGGCNAEGR